MKSLLAATLIEDFTLYPRSEVSAQEVADLCEHLRAGETMPPIIADSKSLRVIDGFHRLRAVKRVFGESAKIRVELRTYNNDSEMYEDALKSNARHGRRITGSELTHAVLRGVNEFKIEATRLALVIGVTPDRIEQIVPGRVGSIVSGGKPPVLASVKLPDGGVSKRYVALKPSVRHLWGTNPELTEEQAAVIDRAPGQPQALLFRQTREIVEQKLVDWNNPAAVRELRELKRVLDDTMPASSSPDTQVA
jgi:hypothetical protein